jgi:two-component system, chemotaxis family, sensor kinase CheA
MAAIRDTFFQECEEQLAELESGLMLMDGATADADTVNGVFRAVHSIKGGAGIFALDGLVRFAHVFETTLDAVRGGRLSTTPAVMKTLLRAADVLADLVREARKGGSVEEARTQALVAELTALIAPPGSQAAAAAPVAKAAQPAAPAAAERVWSVRFKPDRGLYAKANEAVLLLRELGRLGRVETTLDASGLPDLAELAPEGAYLSWNLLLYADCDEAAVREVFEFAEDDCELEIAPHAAAGGADDFDEVALGGFEFFPPAEVGDGFEFFAPAGAGQEVTTVQETAVAVAAPSAVSAAAPSPVEVLAVKAEAAVAVNATIRVDLDRVDRMIDLVGELVINGAMLSQRVLEAGITRASGVAMALDELEHLTREIQDSVMAIRAQPVRSVFQRMPRLVREVADKTGKQVRLLTEGEGTEVDKTVLERISDPLIHMIRNAIDHGLESPADRIAAGKPAEGTVRLVAMHRSGRIVIEVTDDGAGINRVRVKAKAIEKGLLPADAQPSDEEIDNLIFLPGFSTASSLSDISGRGVGMDVVRQSVQALGGRISIASRPGLGSTFSLSLPLTLAVLDGMVVSTSKHTLIIPLGTILETLQPRAGDVHPLDNDLRVLSLRGGYVPIIDVALVLGYSHTALDPVQSVALLVEGEGGSRAVLLVDEIHGQRQVVIKSLETNYRAVPGIAAATVMGDGRVALILDVDAVVSRTRMEPARSDALRSETLLLEAR